MEEYLKARVLGEKAFRKAVVHGDNPYIDALEDSTADLVSLAHIPLGIMDIPLSLVGGTVTRGRQV